MPASASASTSRKTRRNFFIGSFCAPKFKGDSKQFWLIPGSLQPQFLIAQLRRDAALRRAVEVAFHDEIRLIDLLDGVRLLDDGHGERIHAHRPAAKLCDDGFEDALVHFVEAVL